MRLFPRFLEASVVLDEFVKSDGTESVDIHARVEDPIPRGEKRPEVVVRVVVDVAVDHVGAGGMRPFGHRIMAQRGAARTDRSLIEGIDSLEETREVDLSGPGRVVVSENQSLPALERFENRFRVLAPEEQIAEDENGVVRGYAVVPVRDESPVHFLDRRERPVAETDDVRVPEMGVGDEPNAAV